MTVVAVFASALFGIALAATATEGVVVGLVMVGVSQDGQVPALRFVKVPDPPAGKVKLRMAALGVPTFVTAAVPDDTVPTAIVPAAPVAPVAP